MQLSNIRIDISCHSCEKQLVSLPRYHTILLTSSFIFATAMLLCYHAAPPNASKWQWQLLRSSSCSCDQTLYFNSAVAQETPLLYTESELEQPGIAFVVMGEVFKTSRATLPLRNVYKWRLENFLRHRGKARTLQVSTP